MEGTEEALWSISGFEQTRITAAENLYRDRTGADRIYLGDCLRGDAKRSNWSKQVIKERGRLNKGENSERLGQNRGSPVGEPSCLLRGVRVTGTTLDPRER